MPFFFSSFCLFSVCLLVLEGGVFFVKNKGTVTVTQSRTWASGSRNAFKRYTLDASLTQFCLTIAFLYLLLNYELFLSSDVFKVISDSNTNILFYN